MPPAIGIAIASLIATAGGAAYSGYEQAQQPGQNAQNLAAQNQSALSAQQLAATQAGAQKQQAIAAQQANADEQTGGSLNQGGLANLSSLLAGYGGQAGGASALPGQSSGAASPQGGGLQDALSQLTAQAGGTTQPTQATFSGGS
jgi:hypothetical protein